MKVDKRDWKIDRSLSSAVNNEVCATVELVVKKITCRKKNGIDDVCMID